MYFHFTFAHILRKVTIYLSLLVFPPEFSGSPTGRPKRTTPDPEKSRRGKV
jgi:hypothetical protein